MIQAEFLWHASCPTKLGPGSGSKDLWRQILFSSLCFHWISRYLVGCTRSPLLQFMLYRRGSGFHLGKWPIFLWGTIRYSCSYMLQFLCALSFRLCNLSWQLLHPSNKEMPRRYQITVVICSFLRMQDCSIKVTAGLAPPQRLYAGYITAQGRQSAKDSSGFVFERGSVFGIGKAYLGRAYGPHSRVVFHGTELGALVVPDGWDAWHYKGSE